MKRAVNALAIMAAVFCGTAVSSPLEGRCAQRSIQLLKDSSCELNITSFENVMSAYKAYGEDRPLVVGSFEASTGTGKSFTACLLMGCPNTYHSGIYCVRIIVLLNKSMKVNFFRFSICSLHKRWGLDERCPHQRRAPHLLRFGPHPQVRRKSL